MRPQLVCLFLLLTCASSSRGASNSSNDDSHAATVIAINGDARYEAQVGSFKPLDLGQFVVEGDELRSGPESEIQILFPDGTGLVCGAETEIRVGAISSHGKDLEGCRLRSGSLELIRTKAGLSGTFKILSDYGLIQVQNAELEADSQDGENVVSVRQGEALLSDPLRRRQVQIEAYESASASEGRVNEALRQPKRDLSEMDARWDHNRKIHAQSSELMKFFAVHLHERRAALEARRAELATRLSDQEEGEKKQNLEARTKAARERFKAAQSEMGD